MSHARRAGRTLALVTTGALGLSGLGALGAPAEAATSTPYTFQSYAYGTTITGGSLPASSGKTAYALLGCTNLAGRTDRNKIAGLKLSGLTTGAITSATRSYRSAHKTFNVSAVNQVAKVTAGSDSGPRLTITALKATARSWHNRSGYHSSLSYTGKVAFSATPGAPSVPIAFPREGRSVTLPGLGTLYGGVKTLKHNKSSATANGYSLRLHLDASDSTVRLGHTRTVLRRGLASGVMSGRAFGSKVTALKGAVTSGETALDVLGCQGTGGRVIRTSTASTVVPNAISAGVTVSKVRGVGSRRSKLADARTSNTVARVSVGGGQAVIRGIRARAHVHKNRSGKLTSGVAGTTPGRITVNGRTVALPAKGTYRVPNLLTVRTHVVKRSSTGIRVVAVRLTLLSGSAAGSTVDLGNASARIARH